MKMRALVTGCSGLVGHGICLSLIEQGYEVVGTSRRRLESRHPRFSAVQLDLESADSLAALTPVLQGVDVLVHNAARLPVAGEDPDSTWPGYLAVNVVATRALLAAASQARLGHVVHISASPTGLLRPSAEPLTEDMPLLPRNNYASSKIAAEAICLQFDQEGRVPVTILRFPAPYGFTGASGGVVPRFVHQVRAGAPLVLWGTGAREQTFTFVGDIGRACAASMAAQARGIYHIAGPEAVSMTALAHAVLRAFPGTGSVVTYNGQPDPQEGVRVKISTEKARTDFGFASTFGMDQGLADVAARGGVPGIFEVVN